MDAHDITALRILIAVQQEGNYAAAARRLGVHRAIVSKAISKLEERYGVCLAFRHPKKVELTQAAQDLVARCAGQMEAFENALATIRDQRKDDATAGK